MFSEAMLCVAEDVVGLHVVHYLADNDVLHDLAWNAGQGGSEAGSEDGTWPDCSLHLSSQPVRAQ